MNQREAPVFFDHSGKRWRMTENAIVILFACAVITAHWLAPLVLEERSVVTPKPPSLPANSVAATEQPAAVRSVSQLINELEPKNLAVIGSGPLVRVVSVEKTSNGAYFNNPFNDERLQSIGKQDSRYIGEDDFAIQRYGSLKDKHIYLTFDDGPDAIFTPRLLDLLSRESAPATFFVTGSQVAKFPDVANRLLNEGHSIGNHTFSHIDFDTTSEARGRQEINQTQRIIAAATKHETSLFRPPYGGNTDQSLRNSLTSIMTAQHMGYTVASFDYDSNDWHFPSGQPQEYPSLTGKGLAVLLHDGGGNREKTIAYTEQLIALAKSKGYSFASFNSIAPEAFGRNTAQTTIADQTSLLFAQALLVWPEKIIRWLFMLSVATLVGIAAVNILLALRFRAKTKYKPRPANYRPSTTVILPAYNEETVVEKSVRSLIRSRYRKINIIIVDDGSSDSTWQTALKLERKYKRVTALHQENRGKAAALNNAIVRSDSEIVICIDADTLFPEQTISNLVRHFKDKTVGAVAGVVKVGNPQGILTKWQALEYISGISIERNAQANLSAIMIVPGACGAWRRSLLVELGGFSSSTLAEDCDLALKIQKTRRYKILQDNDAISYTEAPQTITALTKQRFRWTFGNIQSLWKHRSMVLNEQYGWLGMFVLPSAIVAILVPILFWPLLISLTAANLMSGNFHIILIFFALSLLVQLLTSAIGIVMAKEKLSYLTVVPLARFTYGPVRIYILYKTVLTILKGVDVGWNKLARTGTAYDPLSTSLQISPVHAKKG